tara:strand:- start:16 stop:198 length:183 start_codon:yes stop_codon:yes gene_type:complete
MNTPKLAALEMSQEDGAAVIAEWREDNGAWTLSAVLEQLVANGVVTTKDLNDVLEVWGVA